MANTQEIAVSAFQTAVDALRLEANRRKDLLDAAAVLEEFGTLHQEGVDLRAHIDALRKQKSHLLASVQQAHDDLRAAQAELSEFNARVTKERA